MKRRGSRVDAALLFGLGLVMGAMQQSARADDEERPPPAGEQESEAGAEPEDAAPPPDFRPTEEIPFDMGIDFPVDI